MTVGPKPQDLRDAISAALYDTKAYNLPARCQALGLEAGTEAEAYNSKSVYVQKRLVGLAMTKLLIVAERILEDQDDDTLEALVAQVGARGVQGELRNLIFASLAKPEIVLRDATRNVIEITRNADKCLIYDQPLAGSGLLWSQLVQWWVSKKEQEQPGREDARNLWRRLYESLDSEPERSLMHTYTARYGKDQDVPALLPQVWLHYDPFLRPQGAQRPVAVDRQRMDFLMLLPGRRCIVLEIDGKHHYADGNRADPKAYARMVSQDRRLRLAGYEVYRFGGAEFLDKSRAKRVLDEFFDELLQPATTSL
ncbi:hypothetical protein [Kocuria carniphila]|uniref:hypothetical protein n=1 Tax=Kocuria carniphila TaxID=262208 RepID=UPI0034DB774C